MRVASPSAPSAPKPSSSAPAAHAVASEHGSLPPRFPLAAVIECAAAAHHIDPRLLAAVGEQESGMGRGAGYDRATHVGADGHGHGIWQMDDRFHAIADAERAGRDPVFAADAAAKTLAENMRDFGTAMGIQRYNGRDATLPYYHAVMKHVERIATSGER